MVRLVEEAGLNHGYLENQVFCTPVLRGKEIIWRRAASTTGRPYLARAAEEHSGPHEPWFWQGERQGGGVLSDMMCHSVEVARHLLTAPGAPRNSLKVKAVNGTVANLKWTRPTYADDLKSRFGAESGLPQPPVGGFRARHDRTGRRRRQRTDDRGDHVLGLCRRRPAHPARIAGAGIFDGIQFARRQA